MPENVPIVFPSKGGIDVLYSYTGWASGLPWLLEYGGNDADSSNEALNCLRDFFLVLGNQSLCKNCDNPGTTLL